MAGLVIERDVLIEAPADVVWRTITEPDQMRPWFADREALMIEPGAHGYMQFGAQGGPAPVLPRGRLQESGRARTVGAGQSAQAGPGSSLPGRSRAPGPGHPGHGRARRAVGPAAGRDQAARRSRARGKQEQRPS